MRCKLIKERVRYYRTNTFENSIGRNCIRVNFMKEVKAFDS
ncbi:hypothetical protein BCD96_000146 [Clostridium beijerinckii]|nr:hypothetical protein [Clostridium beijerinckii]MBA8937436.1 hypothetical protein [Clostridium beijerinckii]NRT32825.1 hypothetical protein [Clostridium beijerinckii]NRT47749.1 hypothetical protein [Clostridium beijerinckii]NRU41471.1 hypothetical protein [Clostridium beijerinckii]NRZ23959.1 hypothetical protein [Clostridium beijerinckii]